MDTAFKRAFDKLEKPFRQQIDMANLFYRVFCIITVFCLGFATGFSYTFNLIQVSILIIVVYFAQHHLLKLFLTDIPTPQLYLDEHERIIHETPRAQFLLDVISFFAKKFNVQKPVILAKMSNNSGSSAAIATSETHHIFMFAPNFLSIHNNTLYGIIAHEMAHAKNEDNEIDASLQRWQMYSTVALIFHLCFLDFIASGAGFLAVLYVTLLSLIFIIGCLMVRLYLSRRQEYLADVMSVRYSGQGQGLIDLFNAEWNSLRESKHYYFFQKIHTLKLTRHPHLLDRINVINSAQKLYDKHV